MLKELMEYLLGLQRPTTTTVDGLTYTHMDLNLIEPPRRAPLDLSSLSSFLAFIEESRDVFDRTELFIHVQTSRFVSLLTTLNENYGYRDTLARALYAPPMEFPTGRWLPQDEFTLRAMQAFRPTEDREALLKVVGNLRFDQTVKLEDDGVTQTATARNGVARVAEVKLPNPVWLKRYETWPEVSVEARTPYILRIKQDGGIALFDIGDAAPAKEASCAVAERISEYLQDHDIDIPVLE